MEINDFNHHKKYRMFVATVDGIEVIVAESQMSDDTLAFIEELVAVYPQRISAIADYLSLTVAMEEEVQEALVSILGKPRIIIGGRSKVLNYGGDILEKRLRYLDQYYGDDYIARSDEGILLSILFSDAMMFELNFNGVLERFGWVITRDRRCRLRENAVNIRNRPGMYVGSISITGVYVLLFQFIEDLMQSSDQGDIRISVKLVERDTCVIACEVFDFAYWLDDTESYDALCLKVVKALSDRCEIHVNNETLLYQKGALVSRTQAVTKLGSDQVEITFRPDKELFSYEEIDYYRLLDRMRELAQLNRHVTFHLTDGENENLLQFDKGVETLLFENTELRYLGAIPTNLHFVEDEIAVSVSMVYCYGADVQLSYANNIRTYDGGAHVQGLYDGIYAAFERYMNTHMDETMVLMEKHVSKRLNFVIQVKMARPSFEGAVRRELGGEEVRLAVKNGVMKTLYTLLESDQGFLEASGAICEAHLRECLEPY
ncbi:MAG: hypothetical protein FWC72_02845 [Oscillospiraceae bacterium]|nr:hypothetical protein [Oscillospiraceae bacterium]